MPEETQSLNHVRVLTLRALKELLKIHGFEILTVKGSCAQLPRNMMSKGLFKVIDGSCEVPEPALQGNSCFIKSGS